MYAMHVYVYMYVYMYVCVCVCVYIYELHGSLKGLCVKSGANFLYANF